ncbi:MAG: hypothetical protein ABSG23_11765 [Terriglobales bacterium]|jgi:hypothetical protein
MLKAILLLSLFVLLDSDDCDPQKQGAKIRSLEADVKQLKADVIELKQKQKATPEHHYELRNGGFRTFRFDPATGDTCIKLTTPADWKRKETKSQSCDCVDLREQYLEMPRNTEDERQAAQNLYNLVVKDACGS